MLAILGGGVAGLAAANEADRCGVSYRLFEAQDDLGGNARTFSFRDHRFDAGAHRLHDRDPEVTRRFRELLGEELLTVEEPSRIRWRGRFIDFPLDPWNLVRALPAWHLLRAGAGLVASRLRAAGEPHLEALAVRRYGRAIAEPFLLQYSEKLWGYPASELSPEVAGRRLEGLDLRRVVRGLARRGERRCPHLEGRFLYPRAGIGRLAEALAEGCRSDRLRTGQRVAAIRHDGRRVRAVDLEGGERVEVSGVVSTLPLALHARLLRPAADADLLEAARRLEFRHVLLVAVRLRRGRASSYASTYFPEPRWPFTRLHEPTVRSAAMSPPSRTTLVAEVPCFGGDARWNQDPDSLVEDVVGGMVAAGLVEPREVIDGTVRRLTNAYPVLRVGAAAQARELREGLAPLRNLHLVGRAATFRYLHLHDLVADATRTIGRIADPPRSARQEVLR